MLGYDASSSKNHKKMCYSCYNLFQKKHFSTKTQKMPQIPKDPPNIKFGFLNKEHQFIVNEIVIFLTT